MQIDLPRLPDSAMIYECITGWMDSYYSIVIFGHR